MLCSNLSGFGLYRHKKYRTAQRKNKWVGDSILIDRKMPFLCDSVERMGFFEVFDNSED